jgi:hypothetical protein
VELAYSFFEMLYSLRVGQLGKETWIEYVGSFPRDKFEVKSFYHVLTISTGSPFS